MGFDGAGIQCRWKREEVTVTNTLYSKSCFGDCNGLNKGSVPRSSIYKDLAFQGVGPSRWSSRSGVSSQKKIFHQSGRIPFYTASGINMGLEDS